MRKITWIAVLLPLAGCGARQVVLNPEPGAARAVQLPLTANITLGRVTAESAQTNRIQFDAKPALLAYAARRGTFRQIVEGPADVALKVSADFIFSNEGSLSYTFKMTGLLTAGARPVGRYESEATAHGGFARFTAAADIGPTNEAFVKALDKLFSGIEVDGAQILAKLGRANPEPLGAAPLPPAAAPAPAPDPASPNYKLAERPGRFALVIGIERYQSLPPAQFAERDAAAVREHLLALGYPMRNIIFLAGDKAGRTGMVKYLETWLPLNVRESSSLFVYFSGHGAPEAKTGEAYLVPWDGDAKFLKDTGYPVKRLYEKLGALKAAEVVLVMDACFSGEGGRSVLAKGTRPLVTQVDSGLASSEKLVVLTASAADEVTGAEEEQGHGLFTYHFLKGLNAKAGAATVKELYDYLLPRVQDGARRDGREQTPALMPADLGPKAMTRLR